MVIHITMSESKDDSSGLEEAQKNQKKAGAAENDPGRLDLLKLKGRGSRSGRLR